MLQHHLCPFYGLSHPCDGHFLLDGGLKRLWLFNPKLPSTLLLVRVSWHSLPHVLLSVARLVLGSSQDLTNYGVADSGDENRAGWLVALLPTIPLFSNALIISLRC